MHAQQWDCLVIWQYYSQFFKEGISTLFSIVAVVVVVQSLSCVRLFATLWIAARQPSLSFTISWILLKLMSIELVMASNHLIICCPFLLLSSIFPASGSFPLSQFFTSGGHSIGVSASASVLPMEGSRESLNTRNKTTTWPSHPTTRHTPWGNQNWKTHVPQYSVQHYLW